MDLIAQGMSWGLGLGIGFALAVVACLTVIPAGILFLMSFGSPPNH
jgi:hypothetical protein